MKSKFTNLSAKGHSINQVMMVLSVRILLQTGLESEMDALSSERTWLQRMCCALVTPDVLICRKRKERFSRKGGNDRKRGWNQPS
jgi:hypothetical protein